MIEIQKARIHDIVHSGFIALNALIPNPIKASIRKSLRDFIGGRGTAPTVTDVSNAVRILDPSSNIQQANNLKSQIAKLSQFKEKEESGVTNTGLNNIISFNQINHDYADPSAFTQKAESEDNGFLNTELYNTNFPVSNPL